MLKCINRDKGRNRMNTNEEEMKELMLDIDCLEARFIDSAQTIIELGKEILEDINKITENYGNGN